VTFTPSATGARTASLAVTDNASGSPQSVSLSGTGVVPPANISLSPANVAFGQQGVGGTTSTAQIVTLSNVGDTMLFISGIALSGTNVGDFTQTNTCGSSVAAGVACYIYLTFTPAAAGTRTATLVISDNASGSPQSVSLTGTGVVPALASVTPTSLNFGQVIQGNFGPLETVTLTNVGSGLLTLTNIAINGSHGTDYTVTDNCSSGVASGGNCAINVMFWPIGENYTSNATMTINTNAPPPQPTVSLTGIALPPPTPPGTYVMYVQANGGGIQQNFTLTVNVQ
jgi:hypothetical protein